MCPIVIVLAICTAVSGQQGAADKLQGAWTVTASEFNGKPDESVKGDTLTIKGDSFTIKGKEGEMKGTLKLATDKKLLTADFVHSEGPSKGKTALAIYEINGDEAKFCFSPPDAKERPSELSGKEGSPNFLVTLKREKK